jgi:hypothetical protein
MLWIYPEVEALQMPVPGEYVCTFVDGRAGPRCVVPELKQQRREQKSGSGGEQNVRLSLTQTFIEV